MVELCVKFFYSFIYSPNIYWIMAMYSKWLWLRHHATFKIFDDWAFSNIARNLAVIRLFINPWDSESGTKQVWKWQTGGIQGLTIPSVGTQEASIDQILVGQVGKQEGHSSSSPTEGSQAKQPSCEQ